MGTKALGRAVRPRRALVAQVVVAALLLVGAASAQAAQTGLVSDVTWGISRAQIDQELAVLKDSGTQWVRMSIPWDALEANSKGSYTDASYLADIDYAVQQVRAAGIQVDMHADGVPYWASADPSKYQDASGYHYNDRYRPVNFQDYADFMAWVANRYKGLGVHTYEVWNEPNLIWFWPSGPDAASYVQELKLSYASIKQADPASTVLMGGLSANDYDYLQAMYNAGAARYFDAANVHPYTGAVDPTWCWNEAGRTVNAKNAFCGIEEVYNTMVRNGDGAKKLWLTEFGYSTYSGTYGVTDAQQSQYLTEAYQKAASYPYVQVLFWYQVRDWSDPDPWSANLGLLTGNFTPKPAYAAFKSVAANAGSVGGGSGSASAPTVKLTSPSAGSTFSKTLSFSASATDSVGITKVQFWLDGTLVRTVTSAPYSFNWRVGSGVSYGSHVAKAVAFDAAGLSTSDSVSVTRTGKTSTSTKMSITLSVAPAASAARSTASAASQPDTRLVRGQVRGAGSGLVALRLERMTRHHRWHRVRSLRVSMNHKGGFGRKLRLRGGHWRVRAAYDSRRAPRLLSGYRYFGV